MRPACFRCFSCGPLRQGAAARGPAAHRLSRWQADAADLYLASPVPGPGFAPVPFDLARRHPRSRIARRSCCLRARPTWSPRLRPVAELDPGSRGAPSSSPPAPTTSAARIDGATGGAGHPGPDRHLAGQPRGATRPHPPARESAHPAPTSTSPEAHFARANAACVRATAGAAQAPEGALVIRPDWEQAVVLEAQLQQEVRPGAGSRHLDSQPIPTPASRASPWPACWAAGASSPGRGNSSTSSSGPDDRDVLRLAARHAAGRPGGGRAHFKRLLELGFPSPTPCA